MVVMGRALIADPALPRKSADGLEDTVIPCIAYNEGCSGGGGKNQTMTCALNPRAAQGELPERDRLLHEGPAAGGRGMPLRQGALRGGRAGPCPGYDHRRHGRQTRAAALLSGSWGARRRRRAAGQGNGAAGAGSGRGLVGCEKAEFLAAQGKDVAILELRAELAPDLVFQPRHFLLERLRAGNVRPLLNTEVVEITSDGRVKTRNDAGYDKVLEPFDTIVLSLGYCPESTLYHELLDAGLTVTRAGDCVRPGKVMHAVRQGFEAAYAL